MWTTVPDAHIRRITHEHNKIEAKEKPPRGGFCSSRYASQGTGQAVAASET